VSFEPTPPRQSSRRSILVESHVVTANHALVVRVILVDRHHDPAAQAEDWHQGEGLRVADLLGTARWTGARQSCRVCPDLDQPRPSSWLVALIWSKQGLKNIVGAGLGAGSNKRQRESVSNQPLTPAVRFG
jgi:hypothetical protein